MKKILQNSSYAIYLSEISHRMTDEDKKLLTAFEGKLRHFVYLYEKLKEENASLKEMLAQKETALEEAQRSRKELEANYTNLKTARIISINDRELYDTKQRLARLVREVDKCIAMLNGKD